MIAMNSSDSNLDMSAQIACSLYDYVEIACMYHYELTIVLRDGQRMIATAIDTKLNAERVECIEVEKAEVRRLLRLSSIHSLEPMTDNAKFGLVVLNPLVDSSAS